MQSSWLEDAIHDVRYAARTLRRTPGFAAITILILAAGIGAASAIFSVVNIALFAPLPFAKPDDLYVLYEKTPATARFSVSYLNYLDWRRQNRTLASIAACRPQDFVLDERDKVENIHAAMISPELPATLGLRPVAGRGFESEEDHTGAAQVAILDEDFARQRYGTPQAAIGAVLRLQSQAYTVIGVAPRALRALGRLVGPAKLYVLLGQWDEPSFRDRKVTTGMLVVARRQSGVTESFVRADLSWVASNLAAAYPDADRDVGITLEGLKETLVFRVRSTLLALLGAVALVLLIACADVANLMLVRAAGRTREFSTRAALGAGAARLARQLFAESMLIAGLGGALGLAVAWLALRYLSAAIPAEIPRGGDAAVDGSVLLCVVGLCGFASVICGLTPALHFGRNLHATLKEGGRSSSGRGYRTQAAFVTAQISLALALLTGSGLMIRTVLALWDANPGFDTRHVLAFDVMPRRDTAANPPAMRQAFRDFAARATSLPGVESAAVVLDPLPLSGRGDVVGVQREGGLREQVRAKPSALWYHVGPEYFRVMRIPLLRGRLFTQHDDERSPRVMLIDENLAKSLFPNEDALGKGLDVDFIGRVEVVGIVGHVNHWNPGADPVQWVTRQMYFPHVQLADRWLQLSATSGFTVVARTRGEPLALAGAVRAEMRGGGQAIYGERSMEQVLQTWLAARRFLMWLLSAFAALALLLACAGVYGVLAYMVSRRSRELSIRLALGAGRGHIFGMVFGYAGRLVLWGIGIGVAVSLALARLIASLLFGVRAADPLTLGAVALILALMSALACYVPARRAVRIDPVAGLR